jgi:hypothetical protein
VRYRTFADERGTSSEPTSAPWIADYRVSNFHHALTFPEAYRGNRIARQTKTDKLILASSDSVRKPLNLLALATTPLFEALRQ